VTVPALAAIGWVVTRPEPVRTAISPLDVSDDPAFESTTTLPGDAEYRCTGPTGSDGEWTYYQYCEPTGFGSPATTVWYPPPTASGVAVDVAGSIDQVLFVDGTDGQVDFRSDLAARLGITPSYELPATTVVEHTMIMPTGADVAVAYGVLNALGGARLDPWTPDLIGGDLPDGIAVVVVVGTDWFARSDENSSCVSVTTEVPASTLQPSHGEPVTTLPMPTTTASAC
jgi:hypothetical protein